MRPAEVEALFAEIFAKRPQVIKPGLERIRAGLAAVGDIGQNTTSVLIGGTNGKGSTAGYLWQMLSALGVRTGLFTSPHLRTFSERVRLSGVEINEPLLAEGLRHLKARLPAPVYEAMSFFELNTLLALATFKRFGSELNIMEVGLGGRWDSTNVLEPCLSVITSIGLDHQVYLGPTTSHIAYEKAGIMRAGRPIIWGGATAGDAAACLVLRDEAEAKRAHFFELGRDVSLVGSHVHLNLPATAPLSVPLPVSIAAKPLFLRENFAKAMAAFVLLLGEKAVAAAQARAGLTATEPVLRFVLEQIDAGHVPTPPSLRARFERLSLKCPDGVTRSLLLDVCHNPQGAEAFVAGMREQNLLRGTSSLPGLVGILADKDFNGILDVLRPVLSPLWLFAVKGERSWSYKQLADRHRDLPWYDSFAHAFTARASEEAPDGKAEPIVICGSVAGLGEVFEYLALAL